MTTIILILGAIVIAWVIFTILVNVIKTTVKTAIIVAGVVLLLQVLGIGPGQFAQMVQPLIQGGLQMIFGR